jgi:hypothetical protein
MKRTLLLLLVIGTFLLSSCTPEDYDAMAHSAVQRSPSPTFIGEYERTAQAMAINAEATKQVAQDNMVQLSIRSTQAASELAQAEAVQREFLRQTQAAMDFQTTQQAMQLTSAQSEFNRQATADRSTMEAQQTATQSAIHATQSALSLQLTYTAVAQQQIQNNAALALTNEAIDINRALQSTKAAYDLKEMARDDRAKDLTFYIRTFGFVVLVIVFLIAAFFGARSYFRSRAIRDGKMDWNGKPILVLANRNGYQVWDPGRALAPGANLRNDGIIEVQGSAADEDRQERVTGRAQMAEFVGAATRDNGMRRQTAMRQAQQISSQPATQQLPSPQVILLPALSPTDTLQHVIDDVENQIIEGELTNE